MPTIIATPIAVDANSYLTLAEANDILANRRLHTTAWDSANDTQKEVALIWATKLLDAAFDWEGAVKDLNQALRWPRVGMLDRDLRYINPEIIPEQLKEAVADLALSLLARDRVSEPELLGQGFSSARVGPLSVTVDPKAVLPLIPEFIIDSMSQWGIPRNPTGGMRVLPIERV